MKNVHITNHQGQVDQSTISVSKSGGEQVTWHSHDNKPATIVFDASTGSPFQKSEFVVPAGGSISSGPPMVDPSSKPYKYTVKGPEGENDPVVIVDN
jgi:hypothetical protein